MGFKLSVEVIMLNKIIWHQEDNDNRDMTVSLHSINFHRELKKLKTIGDF